MHKTIASPISESRTVSAPLLITAILLTAAALRSPITGVGSIIGEIEATTGLSHTLSGLLTTLPLLAFAVFALTAPGLAAKLGTERTLFYCLLLMTGGILIRSLPSISALFAGTALIGIGIAVCNVLLPGLIKHNFPLRVGLMTSLFTSSLNLWAAISSGISVPLAQSPLGWRGMLASWALLTAIAAFLWLPMLLQRRTGAYGTSSETSGPSAPANTTSPVRIGSVWRSPVAWMVTIFMGSQSIMFYISISWLPDILHEQGMSAAQAGWMLSLMQMVSMVGSFLMPLIAVRTHNQKLLTAVSAAFFLLGFGGIWLAPTSLAPLFIILIGSGSGATFSLVIVFFSLRSRTAQQANQLSGMAQSVGYLLAAVGPTLLGFIHDQSGSWNTPLAVVIGLSLLTIVFGYAAGRRGFVDDK
ncbi:CynX/NimT family MFS transporter [Paenibacillus senegalimassiliensis]|uniref:CynX/NimT family MFS transporter n=1 Tax=Paenibacillus senegalimassiliensis TaxID=1737426 RepID=UPI00073EFA6C|nr:MFS transporter [Paenibacillus senegalimassiliensis]